MRHYDRAMAGVGAISRSRPGFAAWLLITVGINVLALIVVN